jgi:RHS repeat-associated core domain
MRATLVFVILFCVTLYGSRPASAQTNAQPVGGANSTGTMPYLSYESVREDINLSNGNVHFFIPLLTMPGRNGHGLSLGVHYNTKNWIVKSQVVYPNHTVVYWAPAPNGGGWVANLPSIGFAQNVYSGTVTPGGYSYYCNGHYLVNLGDHASHAFPNRTGCYYNSVPPTQSPSKNVNVADSDDATYMRLDTSNTSDVVLRKKDGTIIHFGTTSYITDSNGNQISFTKVGDTTTVTDTLGHNIVLQNDPTTHNLSQISYKDSSGTTRTITFTYSDVSISPTFAHPAGATQVNPYTAKLVSSITLPNSLSYRFAYNNFAEVTQVFYPAGGYTKYDYSTFTAAPSAPVDVREIVAKHVCPKSSGDCQASEEQTTTYAPTFASSGLTNQYMDVRDGTPAHNRTRYQFTNTDSPREISRTIYNGESTPLKTTATTYRDLDQFGLPNAWSLPIQTTTTLNDSNQVSRIQYDYDTYGALILHDDFNQPVLTTRAIDNPTETRNYAFGAGAPGAVIKRTDQTWLKTNPVNGVDYSSTSVHILDRVSTELIFDPVISGSTPVAQTQFEYDNYSYGGGIKPSGANQHDAGFGTTYGSRGNLTATKAWRNTDGAWLLTSKQYDDAGNILQTTDPLGHFTKFGYTDSWSDASCAPPSGAVIAFPTVITNALNQANTYKYNSCTGTLASSTDPNGLATTYSYDLMDRQTQANAADGGQTTTCYSDNATASCYNASLPLFTVLTDKINPNLTKSSRVVLDGLGRTVQTQLTSDAQGTVYTDTTYDALEQVQSVSNPYRSGSDITSSPGTTAYAYDALGRKTSETYPDNSVLTTAYCGSSTLVTDATGRWRRSRTDALSHLVEVDEPNAVGASVASSGCPGTGEPIWVTTYGNDVLGNLMSVVQNGSHQRNFTYDSLSRLLTSSNPEVGTITYGYNNDGLLVSKTDARNITTNYSPSDGQIDALHRVTKISYSNGDPSIIYRYDETNCLGLSTCHNVGHRTSMTDAAGSEVWAFQIDATNHRSVHKDQRTTSGITKTTTYVLDYAGNTTQATYPTGRIVNYTFDAANRPSTAADGSSGITYATGFKTSPGGTCQPNIACYTPQGSFYALSLGQTSTFNGVNLTHIYNNRLQPQQFKASSTGGNAIDITYSYADPLHSNKNAGRVFSIANNLDSTRSQSFGYDQLNRIVSAGTFATTGTHCWGYQYSYDAWGNLLAQAGWTPTYNGCSQTVMAPVSADGNNHISAFGYDPSGNTSGDGSYAYSWDAESQLKSAGGINYLYDGNGRRVAKVGSKLYWRDGVAEILAETNSAGTTTAEYIYFGGKRIALLPTGANPTYYVEDMLGTSRVLTTNTGTVCYDSDFSPYGGERAYTNSCPQNYKFEGKERDTETGNDEFGARYYSNRFGRWLSADWSAVPVPIPYANLTNPQTLNLYAMVADDPESFADLDGHQEVPESETESEPNRPEPKEEAEARPEMELWNRAGEAIARNAEAERAMWEAEFWANHPEGWTNPLTGECYAPNPNAGRPIMSSRPGTRGKPDHQQTVKEEAEKMGGETEFRVETPGGKKGHRVIDAVKRDQNGKIIEARQVIRPNKNGTPPKREVDAANDIHRATGVMPRFVPVRPIIPPRPPVTPPTPPDLSETPRPQNGTNMGGIY